MKIDPSQRGKMPNVQPPTRFQCTVSGLVGWRTEIPGQRPLATPAVADGRLFLGGGFGGYEFYAVDAATGRVVWDYQTVDDGPTAAVVADGLVVFNTESCELEVLTVDGQSVWKRWLGDPLMSMPAVDAGRIYMVYPDSRGDRRHYLACFELTTGKMHWKQAIAGELITAPTLADENVYLTTLDGGVRCFTASDGTPRWQEEAQATSSPSVHRGRCFYSQRAERPNANVHAAPEQDERCAWRDAAPAGLSHVMAGTTRQADYLHVGKRGARSPRFAAHAFSDTEVGFGAGKGDSKMHQAMRNLGQAHVSGVWSYQGSRPFVHNGRLYSSMGDTLKAVDLCDNHVVWERPFRQGTGGEELLDALLTPPCLVNGKVFVGTSDGNVHCLDAESGKPLWRVYVHEPIIFQPAVVAGRVFVPTDTGVLYGIETGDADDDGWHMWGATPAHNGIQPSPRSVS